MSFECACRRCGAIAEAKPNNEGWFNGYTVDCPRCGKAFQVVRPEEVY